MTADCDDSAPAALVPVRMKLGGTSRVSVANSSCGLRSCVAVSKLARCTPPASGALVRTAAALPAGSFASGLVPGSVWCEGEETTSLPLRGSNRATRQMRRSGPPTSSHGSQKL